MMGTFTKIVVVIVLGIIAIPVGCVGSALLYETWNTYTHRYRLTIEVDTPNGMKSSSSVIEVSIRKKATWVPQTGGVTPSVRGEAVFVDLANGRNLIAILGFGPDGNDSNYLPWLATETLGPLNGYAPYNDGYWRRASSWTGSSGLSHLPTLVTFSDINDPLSARVVQPEKIEQEFSAGFRFKGAFVEMVSMGTWPFNAIGWPKSLAGEPVTKGIENKFPWWNGPFPWLKPIGGGVAIDTRKDSDGFRWHKEHFRRGF